MSLNKIFLELINLIEYDKYVKRALAGKADKSELNNVKNNLQKQIDNKNITYESKNEKLIIKQNEGE